ncbi:MAG: S9 family peptidase [Candidatus Eremiobacteraeota bacterium]|nr:S9 family peptidase [Candidatus Eremiobacteraeota bacterium]
MELSPDGKHLIWIETFRNAQKLSDPTPKTAIFLAATNDPKTRTRLTAGNGTAYAAEQSAVWSNDGRHIAFLSDARSPDQLQLYVTGVDGKQPRRISRFRGAVSDPRWLPGDRALAVLYVQNAHRKTGATQPGARQTGTIEETFDEQRLNVLDPATGALRSISPANEYVYEYDFSPDGKTAAVSIAPGSGDNNWWIARLGKIDVASGSTTTLLHPQYQLAAPRWSPDGKSIAYIGGIMSDEGSTGGDIYCVDPSSAKQRDLTPGMPYSASNLKWIDGAHIAFTGHVPAGVKLFTLATATGRMTGYGNDQEELAHLAIASHGAAYALTRSSFDRAPEVLTGAPGRLIQFTHSNAGAPRLWGKAVSLRWKSDALQPQGFLVYPLAYNPARKYPMVVLPHGGPAAANLPSWGSRNIAALSSQNYFVFLPNPRGSYGQGEAYTQANIKDFGYGDFRDIMTGVDAALGAAPIDPKRLGLMGWSYGGYVAMWTETQTDRFRAIVAGAGLMNWQSYYGENQIDQWMIPYFGASVYDDPAVYARSSPVTFIKNAKTPALILQGEYDEEVPAPQSFEFWHALKTLNVPAQLVVYRDEGHGIRKPADQIDMLKRITAWFGHYLR